MTRPTRLRGPHLMDWYARLLIDRLGLAQARQVTGGIAREAVERAARSALPPKGSRAESQAGR